jgi:hypothetical protein
MAIHGGLLLDFGRVRGLIEYRERGSMPNHSSVASRILRINRHDPLRFVLRVPLLTSGY